MSRMGRLSGNPSRARSVGSAFALSCAGHLALAVLLGVAVLETDNESSGRASPGPGLAGVWVTLEPPESVAPRRAEAGTRPVAPAAPRQVEASSSEATTSAPAPERHASAPGTQTPSPRLVATSQAQLPPPAKAAAPPAPRPTVARPSPPAEAARAAGVPGTSSLASAARAPAGPPAWPGPGEVDRGARPRWPIRPDYPARARRLGEEARVIVEAWVDELGAVAFSSVLESGGVDFDRSAVRAVERSAFRPARRAGRDVASRVALRIHFQLYD